MRSLLNVFSISLLLFNVSCANNDDSQTTSPQEPTLENKTDKNNPPESNGNTVNPPTVNPDAEAKITSVTTSGSENNYTFNVGIRSNETGCKQYANWWEVISEDGKLIYRRILSHSHVSEQPFVRSGGTVKISSDKVVFIRAHMNTSGYGSIVYKGSISSGFNEVNLDPSFASELAKQSPLPSSCAF